MTAASTPAADASTLGFIPASATHRLPAGMRDWLPEEARWRSLVTERLMNSLGRFCYQQVALPPFEYAEVLQRLGNHDEVLRFVEPESGEIVALRPDMTPQVARLVATRFRDALWPARFCYQGTVTRRRRERARLDNQLFQVGFELVGCPGIAGDVEVLEAATSALRATGLTDFTVDMSHAQVAGALLEPLSPEWRAAFVECLNLKDGAELRRRGKSSGLPAKVVDAIVQLPELYGSDDVWPRAEKILGGTPAEAPMRVLKSLWQAAVSAELAPRFVVDLGETRELDYYTGAMFHLLADGPGEPLGSGGRYDTLFDRFEMACPAAGFAFDVSNILWALSKSGVVEARAAAVLVLRPPGVDAEHDTAALLRELRRRSLACAEITDAAVAPEYAQRWSFTHVLELGRGAPRLRLAESSASIALTATEPSALAEVVAARVRVIEDQ
jgi:ATP phosphoribosyltransferase regulatory subunit